MLLLNRNFALRRADRTHVRPPGDVRSYSFPPAIPPPAARRNRNRRRRRDGGAVVRNCRTAGAGGAARLPKRRRRRSGNSSVPPHILPSRTRGTSLLLLSGSARCRRRYPVRSLPLRSGRSTLFFRDFMFVRTGERVILRSLLSNVAAPDYTTSLCRLRNRYGRRSRRLSQSRSIAVCRSPGRAGTHSPFLERAGGQTLCSGSSSSYRRGRGREKQADR